MDLRDVSKISKEQDKTIVIMVRGDYCCSTTIENKKLIESGIPESFGDLILQQLWESFIVAEDKK